MLHNDFQQLVLYTRLPLNHSITQALDAMTLVALIRKEGVFGHIFQRNRRLMARLAGIKKAPSCRPYFLFLLLILNLL